MKDYNECLGQNGGNDCATGTSTCFNIPGSYYCQCNNGYFGNGTSCFGSLFFSFFCWLYFSNKINNKKISMNVWDKEVEIIVILKQHAQILKEVSYVLVILGILVLVLFVLVLFFFSFSFQLQFQMFFFFSLNKYLNTKTSDSNTITWRNNIQFTFNFMESK